MILEFGAKNFYSFKEGFEVNLRSNDKTPLNVLAIKGANASGKTNVFKLLEFIRFFVLDSFSTYKPDEKIFIDSYFDNDDPIEMYIVFLDDGVEYKYELSLTKDEVLSESFSRKQKRYTPIIQRKSDKIETIDEFIELEKIKLRNNVSIVSMAIQYGDSSVEPLRRLFNSIMTNVNSLGREEQPSNQHKFASKVYNDHSQYFEFVTEILKNTDTGIEAIRMLPREDKETGETVFFPVFDFIINGEKKSLTYYDQSSGTKSLYLQLWRYKIALMLGNTLILDEFDINLHPDLLPILVELFDNLEKNTNKAQLIFSTHNTEIMDKLGKYRVALVNKQENESFLYRLDEIPGDLIRNDRSIIPVYNAGKIGGKPKIRI